MVDISHLSVEELVELQSEIENLIIQKKSEVKNELIAEFRAKAESLGIDMSDLVPSLKKKTSSKAKPKLPAKYRNTDNPQETWTGRGKKPTWLVKELENPGTELNDFEVKA